MSSISIPVVNARFLLCCGYQTMDISKMSSGDASFTAPFKLVAQRNDYIHALVAYFDVSFTMCHKLLGFSTGSDLCNFLLVLDILLCF